MSSPEVWWAEALGSDEPLVTTCNWREYGGEQIVMNTAAMLLMLDYGPGASWATYIDEMEWPD